jgi:formylglycine-generating enzyme required for sulfatase activity
MAQRAGGSAGRRRTLHGAPIPVHSADPVESLGDDATFAEKASALPHAADVSLGDERTLGDSRSEQDTFIDDLEVVDLQARYRVDGTLGQGGMGAVLLATDTRLGRKVAIKRILGEAAGNRMAVQRFLTEAKAIAALNHPNIVQIYDYGRTKDGPFLIMEYVDGGSLLDRCRESALPIDEAIDIACQICDGLGKAHDLGIVHRDIKPANVLLTKDGTPKLTDFGLAKAQADDHGQTMTGAFLGTPDFMPPEQRRDASEVDARSDLWSLAATVYQMVTGRSPRIIRFDLLASELTRVLGRALEDAQDARYQSAREFRDALKASLPSSGPAAAEVVGEGQCPACGTLNPDLNRKFCRNPQCGASLRMACLQCDAQMPVWEAICGDCGTNQPKKLAVTRASLEAMRVTAEERLAEHAFDAAAALADEVAAISLPQLSDLANWGRSFAERISQERTRQEGFAAQKLSEARAHRQAFDYPAGIAALEAVPQQLRTTAAAELLAIYKREHDEATRLIDTIASRIGRKEIDGLLPVVERAIALRGDRQDLAKIRGQLAERLEGRITQARAALAVGDAAAAAKALVGAAVEDLGEEAALLDRVTRAAAAEERLLGFVKEAKATGVVSADEARRILQAGEECLAVNPASENAKLLVGQAKGIIERDARQRREAQEQRRRQEAQRQLALVRPDLVSAAETLALPPLRNSVGIELKLLPPGRFTMGQAEGATVETPHQVTLLKPFYIGIYEVTNAQWKRVMGIVPSKWQDDDRPVERVSWDDVAEFCSKLSALPEERQSGRVYRLPTEAEWEYACRAGSTTKYSFGDDESRLSEYGWYDDNSLSQTHPVGKKKPNAWGLYDMHGNAWEWCNDWYSDYPKGAVANPQGPSGASYRVNRGGSWYDAAKICRSASRYGNDPSDRFNYLGVRLAMSPSGVPSPAAVD